MRRALCALTVALSALAVIPANASLITPISATANNWPANGVTRIPEHTIDGSGLVGQQHSNDPDSSMWLSNGEANPVITWDLGAAFGITGFHLWNYNEVNIPERGIQHATVFVSTDDNVYISLGQMLFSEAPGLNTYIGEDYSFSSPPGLERYVRFRADDNFLNASSGFIGLSEIRFSIADVPEPGMFLPVGIAAFLLFWKRRKAA